MPTAIEQIRIEFAARVARLNYWVPPREQHRREWQAWAREAITVCARAFIINGDRAHMDRNIMYDLWDWERFRFNWPPSANQFATLGGVRAVYRRIAEGSLGIDDRLGPWNGGFFRGLQLSGALRPYTGRQWSIWERAHRDLVRDMEGMSVSNRMERAAGRNGIRRLRRCPASFLPAEPPDGDSVVAGLFAGAVLRRVHDEDWMELPASPEIVRLLDAWTILHRPGRTFRGRETILVPPFYGPLFIDVTPPWSTARLLAVGRPAMCPLLPAICWDLTLRKEHLPVIPFTGALPFSCSMRTFRRKKWKRHELHLMGVRMGINGVDSRLRGRMAAWYKAQVKLRAAPKSMDQSAAVSDPAAPGIAKEQAPDGPQTEIPSPETPS